MNSNKTIELTPNPAFLIQSMRHIGYTRKTALADVIGNSVSAGATCISVQFRWNAGAPWLAILDDGCGMDAEKLRRRCVSADNHALPAYVPQMILVVSDSAESWRIGNYP